MTKSLDGKVAMITGAASGIGEAAAILFAKHGARTVVADRDEEKGEAVVEVIRQAGGAAFFHNVDITDSEQVRGLIAATVERYGRLDCAYNNAGYGGPAAEIADTEENEFDKLVAVNFKGPWLCMKYEIEHMLQNGGGSIVNTASGAGLISMPAIAIYSAAKAATIHMTRVAGLTYAKLGIRVNCVCPGTVNTPAIHAMGIPDVENFFAQDVPMGRLGTPEEIAQGALWLSSDEARYVTGVVLPVDGGRVA
jgi:NAD(P)-dependent dehydrogenase (short-subunit alcohol dehydrogenase family)